MHFLGTLNEEKHRHSSIVRADTAGDRACSVTRATEKAPLKGELIKKKKKNYKLTVFPSFGKFLYLENISLFFLFQNDFHFWRSGKGRCLIAKSLFIFQNDTFFSSALQIISARQRKLHIINSHCKDKSLFHLKEKFRYNS